MNLQNGDKVQLFNGEMCLYFNNELYPFSDIDIMGVGEGLHYDTNGIHYSGDKGMNIKSVKRFVDYEWETINI